MGRTVVVHAFFYAYIPSNLTQTREQGRNKVFFLKKKLQANKQTNIEFHCRIWSFNQRKLLQQNFYIRHSWIIWTSVVVVVGVAIPYFYTFCVMCVFILHSIYWMWFNFKILRLSNAQIPNDHWSNKSWRKKTTLPISDGWWYVWLNFFYCPSLKIICFVCFIKFR